MRFVEPRPSLTDRVYRAIVDEIYDGALGPGTRLVQEQLAARLRVSRQPVQQAMALLKSDGLVVEAPGRGLTIAPLDLDTMRHHYRIRAALDALAAGLAARRAAASPGLARDLALGAAAIVEAGAAAVEEEDVGRMVRCDVEFHEAIYDGSGNPLLTAAAEPHWRYLRRFMGEVLRRAEPPREIWRQHGDILAAIVRGDAEAAAAKATCHVDLAAETLAEAFERDREATAARASGPSRAPAGG